MKFSLSATTVRSAWQNNKPFIAFLFYLLLIHSLLKIIFYNYNHHLLFGGAGETSSLSAKLSLVKWSLAYDLLTLLFINTTLLLLLQAGRLVPAKLSSRIILPVFMIINTAAILLNVLDIFYFRFHFQRANADLLYVIAHPFKQVFHFNAFLIILFILVTAAIIWLIWFLHSKLYASFLNKKHGNLVTVVLFGCMAIVFIFRSNFSNILLPSYPLVEIKSNELPIVENSFHTFAYSVFRGGDEIPTRTYFSDAACDSIFPVKKTLQANTPTPGKKNVVLFIMESVAYDFFDSTGIYKVRMPFFDSILQKKHVL
ncbi:MAG: hypothetical protein IPP96_09730 [Chitinophagaceae bacterium]|nr:hypothetical protein [Chitinophagaceae bacterium]